MKRIAFASLIAFSLSACASPDNEPLETAVQRPSHILLPEAQRQMAEHNLAGLSIAVFENYQLVHTQTFGMKEAGFADQIGEQTAFSTASFAKPVTALLAVLLEQDGAIDLDAPIAKYLKRWRLPQSDTPGAADVTMRQLLSHMGGTSQHGFADFYEGDNIPTLVDSLEGRLPRYNKPIEFLYEPGTNWQYSGGGYVIVQVAIEDVTGRRLSDLVEQRILKPLDMRQSTMLQPDEPGFLSDVAKVHDAKGTQIRTGLPITPQIAASGLWSTPTDLAKFAIAIQKGLAGETGPVVTSEIAAELTSIVTYDHVGGMAMPFFRGFGFGSTDWFRHDGSNTGVNIDVLASMDGGYGFVLMGNGDDDSTAPIFAKLRREIIAQMDWGDRNRPSEVPISSKLLQAVQGEYPGLLYDLGLPYKVEADREKLWIASPFFTQFLGKDRSEMQHLGDGLFAIADYPNQLRFNFGQSGAVESVTLSRPGHPDSLITRQVGADETD